MPGSAEEHPALPGALPSALPDRPPRERMIRAAEYLIRTKGVAGTGVREVVERAEAPWGSLRHYFPGGKDQLVAEAVQLGGRAAARRIERYLPALTEPKPSALFAAFVGEWRQLYLTRGFDLGCPLAATAADMAATSERLRVAVRDGFAEMQRPLEQALVTLGVPAARAPSLALLMITNLEGALILARSQRELTPLDVVVAELGPILDAAVRPQTNAAARATSDEEPG